MSQIPDDGSPVDLQLLFHNLTLYNSASIFWGEHAVDLLDSQQQSLSQQMNAAICKAFEYTQKVMILGPWARLLQSSSTERAIKLVYNFILENSKRAFTLKAISIKQQIPRVEAVAGLFYDLFGVHGFDVAHIQIRQMFMVAEGTTAETLTHLFHLLSRHWHVLNNLRTKIMLQLPSGMVPTASHLNHKLTYLNACIKETL